MLWWISWRVQVMTICDRSSVSQHPSKCLSLDIPKSVLIRHVALVEFWFKVGIPQPGGVNSVGRTEDDTGTVFRAISSSSYAPEIRRELSMTVHEGDASLSISCTSGLNRYYRDFSIPTASILKYIRSKYYAFSLVQYVWLSIKSGVLQPWWPYGSGNCRGFSDLELSLGDTR